MNRQVRNVAPFYGGWQLTNDRLVETIGSLSPEQLALRPGPDQWPIWATAAHTAGGRVYWLCSVCGEPGLDRTLFPDPANTGWEDDLDHPREASELVSALESSWSVVRNCLERWTPEMLQEEFRRERDGRIQAHSRQSILMRLITHDAEHTGEISTILGMNGLEAPDLWTGRARII